MKGDCILCGKTVTNIIQHHLDYATNKTVNVCSSCHATIHHKKNFKLDENKEIMLGFKVKTTKEDAGKTFGAILISILKGNKQTETIAKDTLMDAKKVYMELEQMKIRGLIYNLNANNIRLKGDRLTMPEILNFINIRKKQLLVELRQANAYINTTRRKK